MLKIVVMCFNSFQAKKKKQCPLTRLNDRLVRTVTRTTTASAKRANGNPAPDIQPVPVPRQSFNRSDGPGPPLPIGDQLPFITFPRHNHPEHVQQSPRSNGPFPRPERTSQADRFRCRYRSSVCCKVGILARPIHQIPRSTTPPPAPSSSLDQRWDLRPV